MKPGGDPVGARLWAIVAATVRPFPGRTAATPVAVEATKTRAISTRVAPAATPARPLKEHLEQLAVLSRLTKNRRSKARE